MFTQFRRRNSNTFLMHRSFIARGYVLTEMVVETNFGKQWGLTLADTAGETLVTPKVAKMPSPGKHERVILAGLGQMRHETPSKLL